MKPSGLNLDPTWTARTALESETNGLSLFAKILDQAPLDKKGLALLRGFLMAYEGVDDVDAFETFLRAVDEKRPVKFTYSDYNYRSVYREGTPSFEYDRFHFDPKKDGLVASQRSVLEYATSDRLLHFQELIQKKFKGHARIVERAADVLKEATVNPSKRLVFTLLGPSGNGKTQFFRALALALHGSEDALFKMTFSQGGGGFNTLTNHFRPPAGYVGSKEETPFEKWLKQREGRGGVILMDELLSLHGLGPNEVSGRLQTLNGLYDLLDEGKVTIDSVSYDLSKFQFGITGNLFQELFFGLSDYGYAEGEAVAKRIIEKLTDKEIIEGLAKVGIDPPKAGRLGEIFVLPPLTGELMLEVAQKSLAENLAETLKRKKVQVDVSPKILQGIIKKLVTSELGMRGIDKGLGLIVVSPVNGILFDLPTTAHIEAKMARNKIRWFADGKEVIRVGEVINETSGLQSKRWEFVSDFQGAKGKKKRSPIPHFDDLNVEEKKATPLSLDTTAVHEVYGHWQVNTILSGKNKGRSISIAPSAKALGFVAEKFEESDIIKYSGLTTIVKRIASLEAGHRAPIVMLGTYATGGGGHRPKEGEMPRDDLGKVKLNIEYIVDNHLVSEFSTYSSPEKLQAFRRVLSDLGRGIADEVIRIGDKVGFADAAYEKVMKERILSEKDLDLLAEEGLKKLNTDPDVVFTQAIAETKKALEKKYEMLDGRKSFWTGRIQKGKEAKITLKALDKVTTALEQELSALKSRSAEIDLSSCRKLLSK